METLTFRPIYIEDLALGNGTVNVTLADGSVVALTKVNLTTLASGVASSSSYLDLSQQSTAPGTPAASTVRIYQKTDGYWYVKDSAGTEKEFPYTVGTVTRGVWNATAVPVLYGGTGLTALAAGSMIYASAANTGAQLTIGTSGYVMKSDGTVPTWAQAPYVCCIGGVQGNAINATPTYSYLCAFGTPVNSATATESTIAIPWPKTGTFSSLYIAIPSAAAQAIVAALSVNAAATALTATITAGQTSANDTSNTASVTAGQVVSLRINTTVAAIGSTQFKWAAVFTE